MDHFNPNDFSSTQRRQPPGNPPPPLFPGFRPGPGPGQRPGQGPPRQRPGQGTPGQGPRPIPGGPPISTPPSAPPSFVPSRQISTFRVDASSIRNCVGKFTYIWMQNGDEFWMFPIQVSRNTVTGFRWNRFFRWTFSGVSLDRIDAFICV